MEQIATFHTHLGAIVFQRRLKALGDQPVLAPVPRKLSASCGTCVRFSLPFEEKTMWDEDLDSVYAAQGGDYRLLFESAE